jgi:hypothetical protein
VVNEPKKFDCVQMKWDIQQQLLHETEKFGEEEARRRQWERVVTDPILGPFLRAAQQIAEERKRRGS